ncbi:putative late blight resistance protein-like protein R1B-16 [Forsythia ovata]|uniref:Late blight resistance protein-like protein R1B-16 n=1 Tax=Forsythia ovata TaxID=205694 RepID=A0ABD1WDM4_9LAMI
MEIEEKSGIQDLQPRICSPGAGSSKPAAPSGKITVVGLDDDLTDIKTRLVRDSRELEIVSLVGMGGIDLVIVGSLPNLEVLKLKRMAFKGGEWEPTEGGFCKLKFLLLAHLNLEHWRADSFHFPSLQHLVIKGIFRLKEIPCGIGEILTLQLIELHNVDGSLVASVKEMQEEQRDLGNEGLKVLIHK